MARTTKVFGGLEVAGGAEHVLESLIRGPLVLGGFHPEPGHISGGIRFVLFESYKFALAFFGGDETFLTDGENVMDMAVDFVPPYVPGVLPVVVIGQQVGPLITWSVTGTVLTFSDGSGTNSTKFSAMVIYFIGT